MNACAGTNRDIFVNSYFFKSTREYNTILTQSVPTPINVITQCRHQCCYHTHTHTHTCSQVISVQKKPSTESRTVAHLSHDKSKLSVSTNIDLQNTTTAFPTHPHTVQLILHESFVGPTCLPPALCPESLCNYGAHMHQD